MGTRNRPAAATADGRPSESARIYRRRWAGSRRVVRIRPHLWRAVAGRVPGPLLEIGPGLRPTIPLEGSHFVDVSEEALEALRRRGGTVALHTGGPLPFPDRSFRGVFAFEVLEHIEADEEVLSEIARVLHREGVFVFSVPLHQRWWTAVDDAAGHVRRYEPDDLFEKLRRSGFAVERSHVRAGRTRPWLAAMGARIVSSLPRISTWSLQNIAFPLNAAWQRWLGRIEWSTDGRPIPEEATGITVLATLRRRRAV